MNRRGFLARLGGAFVAVAAAPFLPSVALSPIARPIVTPPVMVDIPTGMSMRLVRQYEVSGPVMRYDVLYGVARIRPNL